MKPNSSTTTTTTPPPPLAAEHVPSGGRLRVHKTLRSAANLANLLPSGTVLAFQTLSPSFSNKGDCNLSHKYLTASLIGFCSAVCFFSCFTDSFTDCNGKQYYGIATVKGLLVLNKDDSDDDGEMGVDFSRFRVSLIDFVHAWASVSVFLAFAFCDVKVQRCLFDFDPLGGDLDAVLVMNLPLAAALFSTFFFIIFPTTRRGIGYSEMPAAATATATATATTNINLLN